MKGVPCEQCRPNCTIEVQAMWMLVEALLLELWNREEHHYNIKKLSGSLCSQCAKNRVGCNLQPKIDIWIGKGLCLQTLSTFISSISQVVISRQCGAERDSSQQDIQLDEVKKFMYMEAYHIMGLLHYFLLKAQVVPGVLRSQ